MKCSLAIVLVLVCLSAAPALGWDFTPGPDYWPLDYINLYAYRDDNGRSVEVAVLPWSPAQHFRQESRFMTDEGQRWMTADIFNIDASGDVYLTSVEHVDESGVVHRREYSPPLKFIDAPIYVGKSWTSSGTAIGATVESFQHRCVVDRAETVTVPYGIYETLVLVETDLQGTHHEGTYYLTRESNPVILPGGFKLVYTLAIVGVEPTSWGGLKALFR